MSPEQLINGKYCEKSDIWGLGSLLFEMSTFQIPYKAQNNMAMAMKIKNSKLDRIPSKYSNELFRVICWCLSKNFEERPSVDDLLNLPQISLR